MDWNSFESFKINQDVYNILQNDYSDESKESFCNLMTALNRPPVHTVLRINTRETNITAEIPMIQEYLESLYSRKRCLTPEVKSHLPLPDVVIVTSSGSQRDSVPELKHVIVDLRCGIAVLRGANVFIPGVMGASSSVNRGNNVAVYVDVDGSCSKGLTELVTGNLKFIGNGTALCSRKDLFSNNSTLNGIAVLMTEPIFDCPAFFDYNPKHVFLQNLPSVVCSHVLDPQPGETILDMCAAPGGKTTHIATLMNDKGAVIALDKTKSKILKIDKNLRRLDLSCIQCYAIDARKAIGDDSCGNIPGLNGPPWPAGAFDRILLDAPCSCLGNRPQLVNKMNVKELKSFPDLQRRLISTAVKLLKDDGTLVYSTCTLTAAENEEMVSWALNSYPDLTLQPQVPYLGAPGLKGKGLSDHQCSLVQRFDKFKNSLNYCTDVDSDTIGFFIAKFVKLPKCS